MRRAIILDRDGTLIEDKGYEHRVESMRIYPGVIEGLKLLGGRYLFFIVTNQPGIGEGRYTEQDFHTFNSHLVDELAQEGIRVEKTYYCPHRRDSACDCRKPGLKHMKSIESEFGIDLASSWVLGDHPSDIIMGRNAGCMTAYLLTGHGQKHCLELGHKGIVPSIVEAGFLSAARRIADGPGNPPCAPTSTK